MVRCLYLACSAFFLIAPRTTIPWVTLPTVSWTLPGKLSTKKIHLQDNLVCEFSQLRFHFSKSLSCLKLTQNTSGDSSVCDILSSTQFCGVSKGFLDWASFIFYLYGLAFPKFRRQINKDIFCLSSHGSDLHCFHSSCFCLSFIICL